MQPVTAAARTREPGSGQQFAPLGGMYGELLDDRISEQFRRKLGDPLLGGRLAELDLEPLALANPGYLAEAEAPARAGNGLALGDESAHTRTVREPDPEFANREQGRRAVALQ
jgi:hypothetical protein